MTVSFTVPIDVAQNIRLAAQRYAMLYESVHGKKLDFMTLHMDLTACHANGCPIDWDKLNAATDTTFAHDISGIQRHINRKTGKLENCFLPRCAAKCQ